MKRVSPLKITEHSRTVRMTEEWLAMVEGIALKPGANDWRTIGEHLLPMKRWVRSLHRFVQLGSLSVHFSTQLNQN